jgi:exodeoxyribonuclease-3
MKNLEIISWNINGIRSVNNKGFSEWLQKQTASLICLQETRALKEQIPAELFQNIESCGYNLHLFAAEKKGYSGVGVLIRQDLDPKVINGLGVHEFDIEGRSQQIVFDQFVLTNTYYPNGSNGPDRLDYKLRYYDTFLKVCQKWEKNGKHVISCGDYNTCHKEIDIARPKANKKKSGFLPIEREWMDKYVSKGFIDTFRVLHPNKKDCYTWWSNRGGARQRNVGWRIDYFFVSKALQANILSANIHKETMGSDHCPISLKLGF